ncbi:hypothetical protein JXA32_12815 [Candidatus Sumerlaeota bacterium]|nr:hypothetical protein [Candidatus Sumerlaeota bacterium]
MVHVSRQIGNRGFGIPLAILLCWTAAALCAKAADSQTVENPSDQLRFEVPADWRTLEGRDAVALFPSLADSSDAAEDRCYVATPPDYPGSRVSLTLLVRSKRLNLYYNPRATSALRQRQEMMLQEINPRAQLENFKILQLKDRGAMRYEVALPTSGGSMRQLRYLTTGEKYHYILIFSAPEEDWSRMSPVFETIVDSLEVAPPERIMAHSRFFQDTEWHTFVFPALAVGLLLGVALRLRRKKRELKAALR